MLYNSDGLVSASRGELFAFWVIDNDLFHLLPYREFLIRIKNQGVFVT